MTTLVLVPTYNERDNISTLVKGLLALPDTSVLVIDDGSPDGTGAVAESIAATSGSRVRVLHRHGPRGFGRSYLDGFRLALASDADVICQMDADLSHDPATLPSLIAATESADLVIGSRYVPGGRVVNWPIRRVLLSRCANGYVRTVARLPLRDCTSGYRCWRRAALQRLPLTQITSDGYAFLVETAFLAAAAGSRIAEVPIVFVERRAGRSKLSARVIAESVAVPWRLRATQGDPRMAGPHGA